MRLARHLLVPWILSFVAIALVGCGGDETNGVPQSGNGTATPAETVPGDDGELSGLEREVESLINDRREEHGLEPLESNPELASVAREYSCLMAHEDFFAHESPDGGTVDDRVGDAGISYRLVGENLGLLSRVPDPAESVVSGWMDSEGHRENILREDFTESGVGACRDGDELYFTQVFLQPR